MKVLEIINEDNTNEAPVSGLRQLGRKAAAYGMQKVGAKGSAKAKGRQVDVDAEANRIKDDLTTTIKGAGEKIKDLDTGYLKNFLGQVGFEDKDIDTAIQKYAPQGELSNKAVDQIILGLTRNASKQTAGVKRSKFATRKGGATTGAKDSKAKGERKIPTGTSIKADDGDTYEWKGAQWINTSNNRPARGRVGQELTAKFQD